MWFGIWLKPILHTKTLLSNENNNYNLGFKLHSFKILCVVEDDKTYSRLVIQKSNIDCHSEIKIHLFNIRAEGNLTNFFCDTGVAAGFQLPCDVLAPRLGGQS